MSSAQGIGNKVQQVVVGVITAVILIVVGVALGPEVTDAIGDINATSMGEVFLGDVIVTLANFVPFFYYLAIVLGAMAAVWVAIRYG
jgi:hypothetical protein